MVSLMAALVLTLVLIAHHADAECAWVLWKEVSIPGNNERYELGNGYETNPECNAEARAQKRFWRQSNKDVIFEGDTGFTYRLPDGLPVSWSWMCLPDTIDPRGPKRSR